MHKKRCTWCTDDPLNLEYHDTEWGVPVYDDQVLFEFLILEGMQAGLSWITILKKREAYRKAFADFNATKIIKFDDAKIKCLLQEASIVRNRLKIQSIITNAAAYLETKKEWKHFSDYIWHFVDGKPIQHHWKTSKSVPTTTKISDAMAKDLKKRGFKFVGSTICYAFMQAVGMVNDHTVDCFRYRQIVTCPQ
ncbi:MAG: DNA-3-methyladenine glycosylase [Coxiella sp. RIFCSPHIGHO2_12_FULL_42_15]|nr:MAG: DNA-3-methyladenine glycosylase [Coxiella sp. RIFCSPHIGHO2_12_FULL_42_15]